MGLFHVGLEASHWHGIVPALVVLLLLAWWTCAATCGTFAIAVSRLLFTPRRSPELIATAGTIMQARRMQLSRIRNMFSNVSKKNGVLNK